MMGPGIEPEQLAIQHVRQPGQRVPVPHVERGDATAHTRPCQAAGNVWILADVGTVVEADEIVVGDLAVAQQDRGHQPDTDPRRADTAASHPLRRRLLSLSGHGAGRE